MKITENYRKHTKTGIAMKTESPFFDINEVSKYLRIPKSTIYKYTMDKKIPFFKIGKQIRFSKDSIDKWVKQLEKRSSGKIQ